MPGSRPQAWGGRSQTLPPRSSLAEQTRLRQVHATPGHTHHPPGHTHHPPSHTHHPPGHAHHSHTKNRLQSAPIYNHLPPGPSHSHSGHTHPHSGHTHPHPGHAHPNASHANNNMTQQQRSEAKFRSRTWGPRERAQFLGQSSPPRRPALALPDTRRQDGRQQAFLVRPTDSRLPCSRCGQAVGGRVLVAVPGLHLHYHEHCFACAVCHSSLVPNGAHSTTVIVRHMQPHCHFCTSDSQGSASYPFSLLLSPLSVFSGLQLSFSHSCTGNPNIFTLPSFLPPLPPSFFLSLLPPSLLSLLPPFLLSLLPPSLPSSSLSYHPPSFPPLPPTSLPPFLLSLLPPSLPSSSPSLPPLPPSLPPLPPTSHPPFLLSLQLVFKLQNARGPLILV